MRRGLALIVLLGVAACAQTFDATTLGVPVTMGAAAGEPVPGTPFRTSVHTVHAFFGLLPLSHPDLHKKLAHQLLGGEQIAELRIKTRSRWSDVLLTLLTAGLLVPKTVTYEGKIIEP